MPLLPLWAVMAYSRVTFTFTSNNECITQYSILIILRCGGPRLPETSHSDRFCTVCLHFPSNLSRGILKCTINALFYTILQPSITFQFAYNDAADWHLLKKQQTNLFGTNRSDETQSLLLFILIAWYEKCQCIYTRTPSRQLSKIPHNSHISKEHLAKTTWTSYDQK